MTSVSPPACGGLWRLKPTFQTVPATLGLSIPARTFMPGGVCGRTDHEHFSRWKPADRGYPGSSFSATTNVANGTSRTAAGSSRMRPIGSWGVTSAFRAVNVAPLSVPAS